MQEPPDLWLAEKEVQAVERSTGRSNNENAKVLPAIIITDALVMPGLSGGGLFAIDGLTPSGSARWLGLVTSNARHNRGQTVPTIGYILPVSQLAAVTRIAAWYAARRLSRSAAAEALVELDVPRPELDACWGLPANSIMPGSKL
jgi:hypothetical protein